MDIFNEVVGIKALQFLQEEVAGIKETNVQAKISWNSMSRFEKKNTIEIHDMLKTKGEPTMPNFELLSDHVSKLKSLLDDREVGLISWNRSVGYFWEKIAEMWGVDINKEDIKENEKEDNAGVLNIPKAITTRKIRN